MVEQNDTALDDTDYKREAHDNQARQHLIGDTAEIFDENSANQAVEKVTYDDSFVKEEPIILEQEAQKAPDGGYGWLIVLGSCLVHILMGGFERSNGVFYLQLKSKYDHSATATSWVLSIFSTLRLALGPLASALCNKYSCRVVVMLGAAISSIGVLLSAFVPDLHYLYFTYGVLGGIGRAFTYTPSLIIVGYYFNKLRGVAVGLSTSGGGFGSFVLPPVIEILFNYYGFMGTFLILSAVMSNFFICGALFRPLDLHRKIVEHDRRNVLTDQEPEEKSLTSVSMATRTQNLLSSQSAAKMSSSTELTVNVKVESAESPFFKRKMSEVEVAFKGTSNFPEKKKKTLLDITLFRNFAFSALCIQLFLFTLSLNTTFVFLPALAKERGVTQLEGAYLISTLGIFDGVSRIVMSSVLDLKRVKPYRLIIYNGVMFLVSIVSLLMPFMRNFWHFAILSGLYGVLSGTYISQKSVVVVDVLGVESLSSSFGLLMMFQGLSGLVGPTVGGERLAYVYIVTRS